LKPRLQQLRGQRGSEDHHHVHRSEVRS
jgi:hypothetical protein